MVKKTNVSDLAEVATCERRVYLKAHLGERTTPEQRIAKTRGTLLHDRAFKQRTPSDKSQDRRCFVASAVYGQDAWQTNVLRDFRDEQLMPRPLGRIFVRTYYALSPAVADLAKKVPVVAKAARSVLNPIVGRIAKC
jgi:hypothetical protein